MNTDKDCLNLKGKLFPHCINKIWKESGCTTDAPLNILKDKDKSQIAQMATEYSSSSNNRLWRKCFGNSTSRGFGSKVSFDNETKCKKDLRNEGELIVCTECQNQGKRNEGIWLYKDGKRTWIPTCQCRAAYLAGGLTPEKNENYDVCGLGYSEWKSIQNISDDCKLEEAWNNKDTTWYYDGKDLIGNPNDPMENRITNSNTIFYVNKNEGVIKKVPEGKCSIQCGGDSINICDVSKLKSCQENKSQCIADTTTQIKSKVNPTDISAKCMYSIPVVNGTGDPYSYYIGKNQITMNAMNCDNNMLYNFSSVDATVYIGNKIGMNNVPSGSLFYANKLYAFKGAKYYRLKPVGSNFTLEHSGNIAVDFQNRLPYPMDAIFVNGIDSMIYILKGEEYHKYSPVTNSVVEVGKITDKFNGVPGKLDSAVHYGGKTFFFKDNNYYKYATPTLLKGPIPIPNITRNIVNYSYGTVIEIPPGAVSGTPLRMAVPNGSPNQIWVYDPFTKHIVNPASGLCMDVLGSSSSDQSNGLTIIAATRSSWPNRRWTFKSGTGNTKTTTDGQVAGTVGGNLIVESSGKCMSGSTSGLRIWASTGGMDQYFSRPFGYVDSDWKSSQIINKNSGKALTIGNSATMELPECPSGTWKYNGTPYSSQHPDFYGGYGTKGTWTNDTPCCNADVCKATTLSAPNINLNTAGFALEQQDSGKNSYQQWWIYDTVSKMIINPSSGFCIDIMNGNVNNWGVIRTWNRIAQDGFQQWQWDSSQGYISPYYTATSERCLYVYGAESSDGARIYLYDKCCAGQSWTQPMGYTHPSSTGTIFLYTGLPTNNKIDNTDVDSTEALLNRDKSYISSFDDAVKVSNQLGGRIATEYEVRILLRTIGTSSFGWTSKADDYTAEGGKIAFKEGWAIVGKDTDPAGVWIWSSPGTQSLNFKGNKECLSTIYPTDRWEWKNDPRAYIPSKIKELCGDLGGCYKKVGDNNYCYQSSYGETQSDPKTISSLFSDLPNYLNSCFVVNTTLYAIKENMVYTISGTDSVQSENLRTVLVNYPITKNILGDSNTASANEELEQKRFFNNKFNRLRSEGNVILRGEQAVASTDILLSDQTNRTDKTTSNLNKLDSTNDTLLRQTTINHNTAVVRDQFNKYLKMLLTFGLLEIMVTLVFSSHEKVKKFKVIAQITVVVIFLLYLLPGTIKNFKRSKNRWNLRQWQEDVPGGEEVTTSNSTDTTFNLTTSEELATACKNLDETDLAVSTPTPTTIPMEETMSEEMIYTDSSTSQDSQNSQNTSIYESGTQQDDIFVIG